MKKTALLCVLVLVCAQPANAQNERSVLEEKITILRSSQDFNPRDTVYINLLNELGNNLRYYQADSLFLLAKQALDLSKEAKYKGGHSTALLRLGDYYSDKGKNTKAIRYYTEGLEIAKEIKHKNLTLRTLNNLASSYGFKGDYAKALSFYLEGIELAEQVDHKKMLSIMNENIANLYASQKDYEQALAFYKKVKKINETLGNEVVSAETMSNLASVYADMGQLEYAMFNVNKGIAIFEKEAIMDWLAYAYEIKGKVYLKQDKFKWALYWYNQSDMLHKRLDDDRGKIDLFNGMAEAYLGQGKDSISEQYALEAFKISKDIRFLEGTQKCAKTLYKLSKNKEDYEGALAFHEVYQQVSDTLSRNENRQSLTMLKTKTDHDKQKQALIEESNRALAKQRNYVNVALFILLIFIAVTFLIHRAQKIQKNLNVELQAKKEILEKRELELQENNETKIKLLSIIGHDLRGPIGALQGLLKLFKEGEIGKTEFLDFIPKLKSDVDHLSFTLNNLLSWGFSQMNGAVTKPSVVALETVVSDNINLLSEIAESKSIKIVSELTENTLTWSDGNQIDIVVRNLISNALKFTPENGMVTIEAQEKNAHWQVSIRDTGVGMDKITLEKLFSKSSNTTTYGTNNEKGTGLGLSLCKEMIEKNNGTIWAESLLRKGSTFYFTLPKAKKKYKKAS